MKRRYTADPLAFKRAIGRNSGFDADQQIQLALPVRISWESLRTGTAGVSDIQSLADVLAICSMASERMAPQVQQMCIAANTAMGAVADRYARCKVWGVDAAALRDIPPILDLYEELFRLATGAQAMKWLSDAMKIKDAVGRSV